MSRLKILDRIKKLLAMTTSSNANEAANAAAEAQRMMLDHKIQEADLDTGGEEDVVEPIAEFAVDQSKKKVTWKSYLLTGVARANGCDSYRCMTWKENKKGKKINQKSTLQVVGTERDVQAVAYIYKYLCNEIDRITREEAHGKGRGYANSFKLGCVKTINDAMRDQTAFIRATSETALTIIDKGAKDIADFMNDKKMKKARPAETSNMAAFLRGELAGNSVALPGKQRQLGAEPARLKP